MSWSWCQEDSFFVTPKWKLVAIVTFIREGRYRRPNITQFTEIAQKTSEISQFLAEIVPVPISTNVPIPPKILKIYITNYFVGVINNVILMIEFLKFSFFKLNLIAFGEVLNSTHFCDSLDSYLFCEYRRMSQYRRKIFQINFRWNWAPL
jgi:hypothetical protein